MDGYCKLHAKIVMSSIWNAPHHTRLLFITMLATADADGNIEGSVGGLAHLARITQEECAGALKELSGPEPDSSDHTTGERIEEIGPGIWHIINHGHYRDRQTRRQALDAARKRKRRGVTGNGTETDKADVSAESAGSVYVSLSESKKKPKPEQDTHPFLQFWDAFDKKVDKPVAQRAWFTLKLTTQAQWERIVRKARLYAESTPDKAFRKNPATWLRARGWENEIVPPSDGRRPDRSASIAVPETRHKSEMDIGDDRCACVSCVALRRDRRTTA